MGWHPDLLNGGNVELEWNYLGSYYVEEANDYKADAYEVYNLRANYRVNDKLRVFGRVANLLDEEYAQRETYSSFSGLKYTPGLERSFYLGVEYEF